MQVAAVSVGQSWMWTFAFEHHEDRTPTHGYEPTREAAMAAFARGCTPQARSYVRYQGQPEIICPF